MSPAVPSWFGCKNSIPGRSEYPVARFCPGPSHPRFPPSTFSPPLYAYSMQQHAVQSADWDQSPCMCA